MLTIFCSPKPFVNEAEWNQRNAMWSWKSIHPDVEIFVFGSPFGAENAASEINAILVPQIECSPSGAPSFNAMAKYVSRNGRYDLQVYMNCDILTNVTLLKSMLATYKRFERFLIVGERLDLAQGERINIRSHDWVDSLLSKAEIGKLIHHGPTGVDYFGFVRGMWTDLRLVYMGRSLCDQALLNHCLQKHIPIIDSSRSTVAVHQYHSYMHVPGGEQEVFFGKDKAFMAKEHHLYHSLPTITDADWILTENGSLIQGRRQRLRKWELTLRYRYHLNSISLFLRALQYLGGKKNLQPTSIPINNILISWCRYFESN